MTPNKFFMASRDWTVNIGVPGKDAPVPVECYADTFPPKNPDGPAQYIVSLTIKGVSTDCVSEVQAATQDLVLPPVDFIPQGFVPKVVTLSVRNDSFSILHDPDLPTDVSEGFMRKLIPEICTRVSRVMDERSMKGGCDITVSFQN